jgi:hypothetical protein
MLNFELKPDFFPSCRDRREHGGHSKLKTQNYIFSAFA